MKKESEKSSDVIYRGGLGRQEQQGSYSMNDQEKFDH